MLAVVRWLPFFTFLVELVELSFWFFVDRVSLCFPRFSWIEFFFIHLPFGFRCLSFVCSSFGHFECPSTLWFWSSIVDGMTQYVVEIVWIWGMTLKTLEIIRKWMGTKNRADWECHSEILLPHKRYDNWKLGRVPNMKRAAHRTI